VEPEAPAVLDIDAVEHERVDLDVQIQGGAGALNDRYGPAAPLNTARGALRTSRRAPIGHAGLAGPAPKNPEDGPHEDTRNRAAERVVPR
jgi:hypothetical protein